MKNNHEPLQLNIQKSTFTWLSYFVHLLLFSAISFRCYALSPEELISTNQLSINTSIKSNEQQIVGQPIIIVIEVASNRWFSKGTQIKSFEIPNTIILTSNEVSTNGTKRINGETWSTQTKEITVFPRKEGSYSVPAIDVYVSINTENDGVVEGTVTTAEQQFTISIPESLKDIEHYIVSSSVKLAITSDVDESKAYAVGDAVSFTVEISALDAPAMMIAPLNMPKLDGLSVYQKTPQVTDKSNRGELIGTRIESYTFIFEKEGYYKIPGETLYWWNSQTDLLEEILISSLAFQVGEGIAIKTTKKLTSSFQYTKLIWGVLLIILLACLIKLLNSYKETLKTVYGKVTHLKKRQAKKAFLKAISHQEYVAAMNYLHEYLTLLGKAQINWQSQELNTLNKLAFNTSISNENSTRFTQQDAKRLLSEIDKSELSSLTQKSSILKLNNN